MFRRSRSHNPKRPGSEAQPGRREAPASLVVQAARVLTTRVQERERPAGSVVVLRSGTGGLALTLAQLLPSSEVLGLESSSDSCRLAASAALEAGLASRIHFKAGRLDDLLLPDASVPLLVSAAHLSRSPSVRRALKEIGRVLAPGGEALLIEPLIGGASGLIHPGAAFGLEELRAELRSAPDLLGEPGLEVVAPDGEAPVCVVSLSRLAPGGDDAELWDPSGFPSPWLS